MWVKDNDPKKASKEIPLVMKEWCLLKSSNALPFLDVQMATEQREVLPLATGESKS